MPDAVLNFLSVTRERFRYRLGLAFRDPVQAPPRDPSLPARYLQVQAASPPPSRVDDTTWAEGLQLSDGSPFDPDNPPPDGIVTPVTGIAPLRWPDPGKIVLDRWLAVPAVLPAQALTRAFAFGPDDPATTPLSFPAVFYPGQKTGTVAGVDYYTEGELVFDRSLDTDVDGMYFALTLGRFFPPERPGADYIVRVTPEVARKPRRKRGSVATTHTEPVSAPTSPIVRTWSAHP